MTRSATALPAVFRTVRISKHFFLVFGLLAIAAQASAESPNLLEVDGEVLWPLHPDRQIQTLSSDLWIGKPLAGGHLDLYLGATLTHPWGSITQLQGSLDQGTFRSVSYGTSVLGAGPALQVRLNAFPQNPFSLFFDASAGILLYDRRFPPGGDIYNFMLRLGPGALLKLDGHWSLVLKGQWMHVSNGQGLGPFNPSYEAEGAVAGVQWAP